MNELEELKMQMKEIQEKLDKLENKKVELERWRAEKGKIYSSMETEVFSHIEDRDNVDKLLYNIGNYFKNEEDTKKVKKYLEIRMKLIDLAHELNEGEEIDWEDGEQEKYYLVYKSTDKKIDMYCNWIAKDNNIYCLKTTWLIEAIKRIGASDLKFFLTFDWKKIYF